MRRRAPVGRLSDQYVMDSAEDLGLAILIAETATAGDYAPIGVVGTLEEAVAAANDDLAAKMRAVERGEDVLCPEQYTVWSRDHDGVYVQKHIISATAPMIGRRASSKEVSSHDHSPLIITTDGFLNLGQACEYRLRYVDPSATDSIWGIDILLANGTSHLIQYRDPGFDQLVDYLEDQGYTISTSERDGT